MRSSASTRHPRRNDSDSQQKASPIRKPCLMTEQAIESMERFLVENDITKRQFVAVALEWAMRDVTEDEDLREMLVAEARERREA